MRPTTDVPQVLARALAEELKDARVVSLGKGTHGSTEFQDFRLLVARELVERHGFAGVAAASHPLMRWLKDPREMALVGIDRAWSDQDHIPRRLQRCAVSSDTPTDRIPAAVRAAPQRRRLDLELGDDGLAWIRRGDAASWDAFRRMLLVGATAWPRHHVRLDRTVTEALDHLVVFDSVADTAGLGCDTPWRR